MIEPNQVEPRTPQGVSERLIEFLGKGDINAALTLYENNANFNNGRQDGVSVGLEEIRESLERFTELRPTIVLSTPRVIETDGIALVTSHWLLKGTKTDGTPVDLGGHGADVMRRQSDGSWRFLIDNAWAIEA